MKRTTLSLIAAAAVLAAVTGAAAMTAPAPEAAAPAAAPPAARLPVERAGLLCPAPSTSEVAETTYTSYTPPARNAAGRPQDGQGGEGGGAGGKNAAEAVLKPAAKAALPGEDAAEKPAKKPKEPKVPATVTKPGTPVAAEANGGAVPALTGAANGALAPGWTVQQTTVVPAGGARGLLGLTCSAPDSDFWFPAASTAKERQDYVHLTNPDDSGAVADIELYGPDGTLKTEVTEGIPVPAHSTVPVLLSTLTGDPAQQDLTVHVTTRSGRVGAALGAADDKLGSDWLPAAADPAGTVLLPGIPADATSVRLVAFAPGDDDADLKVQLVTPTGTIVPASADSVHVKSGMTTGVDLAGLTRGEPGSLLLTPADPKKPTPVVAAVKVVRGKSGEKQEVAFIPGTGAIEGRATVADNRDKGTTLAVSAPAEGAQVRITASAGAEGGTPVTKNVTVKAGTTVSMDAPVPDGVKGPYALTVERLSGGPVYAARTLELPQDGVPMFTVQTFTDDRSSVRVPRARQDLTVLDD
ncbi:hypothetical protein SLA_2754 [Streptomyces laurentii]|uniref:Secreted protein n=1 Tax=Streptomyces laurentii TaxID=39478 RepID=A0A169NGL3_STRLU|nr:hypothetical protein SLA_2754 [Streptomyces laurentii]